MVAAFAAGGADYVTKPIRPAEVLARIAAHISNARQMRQARSARRLRPGHRRGARRRQPHRLADAAGATLLNTYFANPETVAPEELLA
jgi:DNA-binding response OmpR family regulator